MKALVLFFCSGLNWYLLAAMAIFAVVSYPQFGAVERSAFPSLYSAFTGRIGGPVVAFEFLAFFATLALYGVRSAAVPVLAVHALVACGVGYFVITFGWHLPAHRALAAGDNSVAALAPLLASQWARTVVQIGRCALLGWMHTRL